MKKIIIISLIFTFIQAGISNATEPNLIGWWKFDEGEGSIARDSAGSNDGTIYGATWTSGRIDGALDFGGDDGVYLEGSAGADSPLNIYNSDLTISSWVKIRGTGGTIVARAKPYYITYRLGISANKAYINTYKDPDHWNLVGDEILNQHVWYHIVGVFDRTGDKGYVYVNGVEDANGVMPTDPLSNDAATKIGCRNATTDFPFDGTIDDVRIYNRALSDEEILQLYCEVMGGSAFNPYPADGAAGVDPNVILSWSPGIYALSHDVYFGLDYNDVNDATVDSNEYMDNFDVNSYDPNGLALVTTYYWRIDEVNGPNVWKGDVWSFGTWPVIGLSAEEFEFYALEGGANLDDQMLSISNSGAGTLNWEIAYDCNWLQVYPTAGSSTGEPNEVTLSVDVTGLVEGIYDCNLTISAPNAANSPRTVEISLVVHGPIIELSAEKFVFTSPEGGPTPPDQILTVRNSGGKTLNWEITYDCNWLQVYPTAGSSTGEPNEVTLSVDITGLAAGEYHCSLTISDPNAENSPQTVVVTLWVECFPVDHPDYDEWVKVGRPPCWCYPRQCHGDADDTMEYIAKKGYYYCHFKDLSLLLAAWRIREPPEGPGIKWPNTQICADFGHNKEIICKCGYYRVHFKDLSILISNWNVREPPDGPGIPPDCLDVP